MMIVYVRGTGGSYRGGVPLPVHRFYNKLFTVHEINKQNMLINEENKKNFGTVLLVKMRVDLCEAYSRPGYAKF